MMVHTIDTLNPDVFTKLFTDTSSTKLELQTLLWALNELKEVDCAITVFTDSQNIIGLKDRRERFEKNNYYTSKNKIIANAELYQAFYKITDKFECTFVKVKGHKLSKDKDKIDRLFTFVDRASREELRKSAYM